MLAVCAPAWADLKIGVVNYQRLMQEAPQAKAVQQALRTEFASKQRELTSEQQQIKTREAELQRNQATMSPDQLTAAEQSLRDRNRQYSEKVNEYQDDFNAKQNQELSKLQQILVQQVQQYARAQRFDLVLAEGVIWANPTIDITQPVLAQLQAASASSPRSGTSSAKKR